MYKALIMSFLAGSVIAGCGMSGMGMFGMGMLGTNVPSQNIDFDTFLTDEASNGERIFVTGFNIDGDPIGFEGGPAWLYMHGGGCASCHGIDGNGGQWVMMSDEIAPDIRYSHLTEEEHEEGEEHPPYDDQLLARAIREGLNPADEELDPAMPRWNLSDRDMADLINYLKELDGEPHE